MSVVIVVKLVVFLLVVILLVFIVFVLLIAVMLTSIARQSGAALRVLLVMTLLLGVVYPLGIWLVARVPGLSGPAQGSVVRAADGTAVGSSLIGIDPGAPRPAYPLRLLLLPATMAFHAFFGVSLLSSEDLLQAGWFTSLGLGVDALADQRVGGGIAWGIGELPTVLIAFVLAVQWSRSDAREARRTDRAADRDDDAALAGYNAMLGRIGDEVRRQDDRP